MMMMPLHILTLVKLNTEIETGTILCNEFLIISFVLSSLVLLHTSLTSAAEYEWLQMVWRIRLWGLCFWAWNQMGHMKISFTILIQFLIFLLLPVTEKVG